MALGADEMQKIAKQVLLGLPLTNKTPEAKKYAAAYKKDIDAIHAKGGHVDITHEWPDVS